MANSVSLSRPSRAMEFAWAPIPKAQLIQKTCKAVMSFILLGWRTERWESPGGVRARSSRKNRCLSD